jgi:ABC-2 type transport system permease protein
MASPTVSTDPVDDLHLTPPTSIRQIFMLARFQLREYLRSRRFIVLALIIGVIGLIITAVVAHFRSSVVSTNTAFYASFWGGGVSFVIVLAAVFFGGDAIAGEFQNKTGYFLMGLPIRRATVYAGKFIAAFVASAAMVLLFLAILVANGAYYFGDGLFPWELGLSLLLSAIYLLAALGATFLFSSLFKVSAYGFVLTAILFLFGFTILQELVTGLVKMEPWFVISYANSTIANVFSSTANWGFHATVTTTTPFGPRGGSVTSYTPGIGEGILIMLVYFFLTAIAGLLMFEREEFS